MVVAIGANEYLANQKSFYVGISRAVESATLITDNPERLAERIEANTGAQILALDAFVQSRIEREDSDAASNDSRRIEAPKEPEKDPEQEREKETTERQMIMDFERGRDIEDMVRELSRGERTR